MGIVKVTDLLVYGYHGCLKEESIIGSEYLINIKAWSNIQKANLKTLSIERLPVSNIQFASFGGTP